MDALYTGIISVLNGSQSTYCSISGDAVSALTNGRLSRVCRVYISKADNTTLDYLLYNSNDKVIYTGRIGSGPTVVNITMYPTRAEIASLDSRVTALENK